MKMLSPLSLHYTITLLTGLHIGGSSSSLKIWGIDSEVVKHPLTWEPYIPGSSIKGKMRALIEMSDYPAELFQHNYAPVQNPDTIVAQYLGAGGKTTTIPAKILFDDFRLTSEWKTLFDQKKSDFFEDKSENSVPRFGQGNANPRHIERVPAGVIFEGKITLIPHEGGDIDCSLNALREFLERGIALLEENYIGWGGSRGSGRIKFTLTAGE